MRQGARLLGAEKPDKAVVQQIADRIVEDVYDIRAAIWEAAWLFAAPPKREGRWLRPWENWLMWMPKGGDPYFRLNSLYWELVEWTFAHSKDERGYRRIPKAKWDARRFQKLSALQLPKDRVFGTLVELSVWRGKEYDPYVCVLKIAKIWEAK